MHCIFCHSPRNFEPGKFSPLYVYTTHRKTAGNCNSTVALSIVLSTYGIPIMDAPWTKSPEEILAHFNVDPDRGLSNDQAAKHAEIYGKNGAINRFALLSAF